MQISWPKHPLFGYLKPFRLELIHSHDPFDAGQSNYASSKSTTPSDSPHGLHWNVLGTTMNNNKFPPETKVETNLVSGKPTIFSPFFTPKPPMILPVPMCLWPGPTPWCSSSKSLRAKASSCVLVTEIFNLYPLTNQFHKESV